MTAAEKRRANLEKARETKKAADQERARLREAGVPTPLERFRKGEYPISEWSDEEISRGRPANRDGTFDGPWPRFSGKEQSELKRELLKRGQRKIDSLYQVAIETLEDVAKNGDSDAARVKAALALAERTAGKVPERIELKSADPWQDILDEVLSDDVLERVKDEAAKG